MLLKDKVALVTGASRGLGNAVAKRFSEEGAKVLLWSRDRERLESTRDEIMGKGGEAFLQCVDLSSVAQIREGFCEAVKKYPTIDIVVNCAGLPLLSKFLETTEEQFDSVFALNTRGAYFFTQAAAKHMVDNTIKGSIINISSISAKTPSALLSVYSASKSAVITMTQALAKELAPNGIRVNAICPGAMDTEMFHRDSLGAAAEMHNTTYERMLKGMLSMIPLKRILDPLEVADFIAFLVSDKATGITGQSFNICCGMEVH